MQQTRSTQRKLVGLLVKLAHKGLDEFAAKYATNLSEGGMFIRTREPRPVGTELSFKVEIANGLRVLEGTALVKWTRPDNDPGGPPGMGLEFVTLEPSSRELVDRMLGRPPRAEVAAGFDPFDRAAPLPKPPAPAAKPAPPAAASVAPAIKATVPRVLAPTVKPLAAPAPDVELPVERALPDVPPVAPDQGLFADAAPTAAPDFFANVAPDAAPPADPEDQDFFASLAADAAALVEPVPQDAVSAAPGQDLVAAVVPEVAQADIAPDAVEAALEREFFAAIVPDVALAPTEPEIVPDVAPDAADADLEREFFAAVVPDVALAPTEPEIVPDDAADADLEREFFAEVIPEGAQALLDQKFFADVAPDAALEQGLFADVAPAPAEPSEHELFADVTPEAASDQERFTAVAPVEPEDEPFGNFAPAPAAKTSPTELELSADVVPDETPSPAEPAFVADESPASSEPELDADILADETPSPAEHAFVADFATDLAPSSLEPELDADILAETADPVVAAPEAPPARPSAPPRVPVLRFEPAPKKAAAPPIEAAPASLEVAPAEAYDIDISFDVFGAVADGPSENSVLVDYEALLADTPPAPPAPPKAPPAIDPSSLESIEPLPSAPLAEPAAPHGLPLSPLGEPELPTLRRDTPSTPAPTPVEVPAKPAAKVERPPALVVAPPPPPPEMRTVYLRDVKPSDGTGPIIGIDLGTTNSACAVLTKGRPIILSSKDGYNTIPSVVSLTAQGKLLVGRRAKSQMVLNPTQSIFGAKRLVGREFDSPTVKQLKESSHFEIVAGDDRRAAVTLGGQRLSLDEVQGLILKECRDMAEQALGVPVSRAVVTCPAYYSEPQREAVRRAGALAGLKIERVLNEPTAAALAFGMNRELTRTVLVYDLGGGTFDATLLKLDQNVFEVLATGGDVFLGGVDFDAQITGVLLERFAAWHKRPFKGDRVALSRLAEAAEHAKIALSERATCDVHLPMLELDAQGHPLDLRTTLTRADVEAACADLIDRTLQAVQDVLLDAKLKASQVDDIILVGGMSRMPMVREKLKALFKKSPHASVNADEAVALGAALYSGSVDKVSSLVLIDVVPMTIGLGRPGGQFHRLIERNTPLPATKSFGISTQKDNETELEVMIFQGEDSNVAGNEFLGALTITGLPKAPKGAVQVAVTLGLDAECVLRVEAREFKTRTVVRSVLATRYTTEEIAQRLGISAEKQAAVNKSRHDELEKRAGGFWGALKKIFKR